MRGHRFGFTRQNPQQQVGGTHPCLVKIHMGIGVIGHNRIAVLQHAVGQHPMQIERDNNGHPFPHNLAHPSQQPAFGVILPHDGHRPVQREIDAIHGRRGAHRRQKFFTNALKARRPQGAPRGNRAGAVGGDKFDVSLRGKNIQRPTDFRFQAPVKREHFVAKRNVKVGITARHWIK